jgi:hypothetical protein
MHSLLTRLLTQGQIRDQALKQCEADLYACIRDWKMPDIAEKINTGERGVTHEALVEHQKKIASVAAQLMQEREYIQYERLSDICSDIAMCLPQVQSEESVSDIQEILTLAIYMAEEAERGKQGRALNARIQNGERLLSRV